EAADDVAAHFIQTRPVSDEARIEGRLVRNLQELAVTGELPAVKGAGELADAAAIVQRNAIAAVRTDIVEGLDGGVVLAHQQNLFMAEFEHMVVAALGQVGGHAGQEPDARPKPFPFCFMYSAEE